jgi:hypothetical protein
MTAVLSEMRVVENGLLPNVPVSSGGTTMSRTYRCRAKSSAIVAMFAAGALVAGAQAKAGTIGANADAFQTMPGDASVTLPGLGLIPLEGAEFSPPGTDPHYPLTAAEVARLNVLAPNLGLVKYELQWVDAHGSVVGPTSEHKVGQILVPVLNTTPTFDTVIQRMSDVTLTAPGQVGETPIRVLMLNLQSVTPIPIGGFHYELIAVLANGSPVFDPTDLADPQFMGNVKFHSTAIDANGGVYGTLDLGVTGPTPTSANLGANLPSGMEGLPVNFDIQFIPLDGGPAIQDMKQEVIFQNNGPSQFQPINPEPSSFALLFMAGIITGGFAAQRRRMQRRRLAAIC